MIHQKLKIGKNTYFYSQLSPVAKQIARITVIAKEIEPFRRDLTHLKSQIKSNIHTCINDKHKLPSLIRQRKLINRLATDDVYCAKFIESNVLEFLVDGQYKTFFDNNGKAILQSQ